MENFAWVGICKWSLDFVKGLYKAYPWTSWANTYIKLSSLLKQFNNSCMSATSIKESSISKSRLKYPINV